MKPAVLIVGGGALQVPVVEAARSLGLAAIVTDRRGANSDAGALADEVAAVDTYDAQAHEQLVLALKARWDLQGVFTAGADVEVTVARAAAVAGTPGIAPEAAARCHDKVAMRTVLGAAGISPLWWRPVTREDSSTIGADPTVPYPVVVKPADACASRGTTIVEKPAAMPAAVLRACGASSTGQALVEKRLLGTEHSVEILFDRARDRVYHLNVVDRFFDGVIELGHVTPSARPQAEQDELYALARRAARALGVDFGAFKVDAIWTADGPRVLEVTARLSGGWDSGGTTPLASGRNTIRAALKLAVGIPLEGRIENGASFADVDLVIKRLDAAAAWAVTAVPGRVLDVCLDFAQAVPGAAAIKLRTQSGDVLSPLVDCAARPGFVLATGRTYAEALAAAREGAEAVVIRTQSVDAPLPEVQLPPACGVCGSREGVARLATQGSLGRSCVCSECWSRTQAANAEEGAA